MRGSDFCVPHDSTQWWWLMHLIIIGRMRSIQINVHMQKRILWKEVEILAWAPVGFMNALITFKESWRCTCRCCCYFCSCCSCVRLVGQNTYDPQIPGRTLSKVIHKQLLEGGGHRVKLCKYSYYKWLDLWQCSTYTVYNTSLSCEVYGLLYRRKEVN